MKRWLILCCVLPSPALAEWDTRLELRSQYIAEDNRDLGTTADDADHNAAIDARFKALYEGADFSAYTEARGALLSGDFLSDDETGENVRDDGFLEMREFWGQWKNVGVSSLSLQAGRQRIKEERGLWWNDNIDALRVRYDTTQFSGFFGVGQNFSGYSTADEAFEEDDKNRLRVFTEGSWLIPGGARIEARGLYEHDHSGTYMPGRVIDADDRDDSDGDLFWAGLRFKDDGLRHPQFSYRADLLGVVGSEEITASTAGPGNSRTVGGTGSRDVMGMAFDGEINFKPEAELKPTFTLGYAYGSGDDGNGDDHGFRQSDLESNTSALHGPSRPLHNYGEALRPELSNLHIISAAATIMPNEYSDLTFRYFRYWRPETAGGLRSGRLAINPAADDADIGQAVDAAYNLDVGKQFSLHLPAVSDITLRTSAGAFRSGEAFGPEEGEVMWRGLAEVQLNF